MILPCVFYLKITAAEPVGASKRLFAFAFAILGTGVLVAMGLWAAADL